MAYDTTAPVQHPLTAIFNIADPVETNYKNLEALLAQFTPNALNAVGTVHFARFIFMDYNSNGVASRVAIITTFDGDWMTYIQDFVNVISDFFNALLACVEGGAACIPVEKNTVAFGQFVLRWNNPPSTSQDPNVLVDPPVWYSAYPTKTVKTINGPE